VNRGYSRRKIRYDTIYCETDPTRQDFISHTVGYKAPEFCFFVSLRTINTDTLLLYYSPRETTRQTTHDALVDAQNAQCISQLFPTRPKTCNAGIDDDPASCRVGNDAWEVVVPRSSFVTWVRVCELLSLLPPVFLNFVCFLCLLSR